MGRLTVRRLLLFIVLISTENSSASYQKPIVNATSSQQCFASKAAFDSFCANSFFGVSDGTRCYFMYPYVGGAREWANAWQGCKEVGGVLAQIQTQNEYTKAAGYAQNALGTNIQNSGPLLAMQDTVTKNPTCGLGSDTTYWYDDAASPNTNMLLSNTYMGRYHKCDDIYNDGALPRCFLLWYAGPTDAYHPGGVMVGANDCNGLYSNITMCMFAAGRDSYTKESSCMGETPVQIVAGSVPNDCATICNQYGTWCRSFNFIFSSTTTSNNNCELFSWSSADTNKTKSNPLCAHYNYVP